MAHRVRKHEHRPGCFLTISSLSLSCLKTDGQLIILVNMLLGYSYAKLHLFQFKIINNIFVKPTSLTKEQAAYVPVNSKTANAPPWQTPRHLTFLKNFGQIPRYVASLDGQMPHPLELHRGSNPPPSRHVKANCGNKFCKIFRYYEFLVQLAFGPHFKQRHIPR